MGIVKDLLFILLLLCIICYCLHLYIILIRQKEYFISALKHDLKIPLLAQIMALDAIKTDDVELIDDIKKSCRDSLDMVNVAIRSLDFGCNYSEIFAVADSFVDIFIDLGKLASKKNIDFYYDINNNIMIQTCKDDFQKFIENLLILLINNSPNNGKIYCSAYPHRNNLFFSLACPSINKNIYTKNNVKILTSIGYYIKIKFCMNYIKSNGWYMDEHVDKYNVKTFTIKIPIKKNVQILKTVPANALQQFS